MMLNKENINILEDFKFFFKYRLKLYIINKQFILDSKQLALEYNSLSVLLKKKGCIPHDYVQSKNFLKAESITKDLILHSIPNKTLPYEIPYSLRFFIICSKVYLPMDNIQVVKYSKILKKTSLEILNRVTKDKSLSVGEYINKEIIEIYKSHKKILLKKNIDYLALIKNELSINVIEKHTLIEKKLLIKLRRKNKDNYVFTFLHLKFKISFSFLLLSSIVIFNFLFSKSISAIVEKNLPSPYF